MVRGPLAGSRPASGEGLRLGGDEATPAQLGVPAGAGALVGPSLVAGLSKEDEPHAGGGAPKANSGADVDGAPPPALLKQQHLEQSATCAYCFK